jgi:hypothetical protein
MIRKRCAGGSALRKKKKKKEFLSKAKSVIITFFYMFFLLQGIIYALSTYSASLSRLCNAANNASSASTPLSRPPFFLFASVFVFLFLHFWFVWCFWFSCGSVAFVYYGNKETPPPLKYERVRRSGSGAGLRPPGRAVPSRTSRTQQTVATFLSRTKRAR